MYIKICFLAAKRNYLNPTRTRKSGCFLFQCEQKYFELHLEVCKQYLYVPDNLDHRNFLARL